MAAGDSAANLAQALTTFANALPKTRARQMFRLVQIRDRCQAYTLLFYI